MNDNLKELAGKANFGNVEDGEVVFDPRLEVFAEFLINEICKKMVLLETEYPANLTAQQIKKFYGVEQ
jgi:hypothetical protein